MKIEHTTTLKGMDSLPKPGDIVQNIMIGTVCLVGTNYDLYSLEDGSQCGRFQNGFSGEIQLRHWVNITNHCKLVFD